VANLKEWITKATKGKEIVGVVIGRIGWADLSDCNEKNDYGHKKIPNYLLMPKRRVLTWEEAQKWLDYKFDSGYGSQSCNTVYVWTEAKVFGISQYDGAVSMFSMPRNPIDCEPEMPGS